MPAEEEVHARHILVVDRGRGEGAASPRSRRAPPSTSSPRRSRPTRRRAPRAATSAGSRSTDMVKEFADAAFDLKKGELERDAGQDAVRLPRHQGRGPPPGAAAGVRGAGRPAPRGDGPRDGDRPSRPAALRRQDREIQHRRQQGRPARRPSRRRPPTPAAPPRRAAAPVPSKTHVLRVSGVGSAVRPRPDSARRGRKGSRWPSSPPYRRSRPRRRRRCRASRASSSPRRASGVRYKDRDDVMLALVPAGATIAGVLTRSKTSSAPVDWCRKNLAARQGARDRRQCRQRQRLHRQAGRQGGRGEHARHGAGAGLPAQRGVHGLDRRDRPAARLGEDRRRRAGADQGRARGRLGGRRRARS